VLKKMKLLGATLVLAFLFFRGNAAFPVNQLAVYVDTEAKLDALLKDDVSADLQYGFDISGFIEIVREFLNLDFFKKLVPKMNTIVKASMGRIVTNLIFQDFEGLKNTAREMAKQIIVAFDDAVMELVDYHYNKHKEKIEESWNNIVEWWTKNKDKIPEMFEEKKKFLFKKLQDYLIKMVNAATDCAVDKLESLRYEGIGNKGYIDFADIQKIVDGIRNTSRKFEDRIEEVLYSSVLSDRAFVEREVQRYKNALVKLGKGAILVPQGFIFALAVAAAIEALGEAIKSISLVDVIGNFMKDLIKG